MERKIDIAGGESQYNLLAISSKGAVTLIDTSALVFPDAFHPSGAVRLSIEDVNSDGTLKVVLEADTIVSLQFLGSLGPAMAGVAAGKGGWLGGYFQIQRELRHGPGKLLPGREPRVFIQRFRFPGHRQGDDGHRGSHRAGGVSHDD